MIAAAGSPAPRLMEGATITFNNSFAPSNVGVEVVPGSGIGQSLNDEVIVVGPGQGNYELSYDGSVVDKIVRDDKGTHIFQGDAKAFDITQAGDKAHIDHYGDTGSVLFAGDITKDPSSGDVTYKENWHEYHIHGDATKTVVTGPALNDSITWKDGKMLVAEGSGPSREWQPAMQQDPKNPNVFVMHGVGGHEWRLTRTA